MGEVAGAVDSHLRHRIEIPLRELTATLDRVVHGAVLFRIIARVRGRPHSTAVVYLSRASGRGTCSGDDGRFGAFVWSLHRAVLMGGRLMVWSKEGAGTAVELCIPSRSAYVKREGGAGSRGRSPGE